MKGTEAVAKTTRSLLTRALIAAVLCAGLTAVPATGPGYGVAHAADKDDERPSPDAARDFVAALADKAISVLGDGSVETSERMRVFETLLRDGFNLPFLARLALGRYRAQADEAQLSEYETLFADFVLQKYSGLLGAYSGQTLAVVEARPAGSRDVFVQSRVSGPDTGSVRVDWRVRDYDGSLKIIDVVVENVSMVISQREEFGTVIRREGFDGLLRRLRAHKAANAGTAG